MMHAKKTDVEKPDVAKDDTNIEEASIEKAAERAAQEMVNNGMLQEEVKRILKINPGMLGVLLRADKSEVKKDSGKNI